MESLEMGSVFLFGNLSICFLYSQIIHNSFTLDLVCFLIRDSLDICQLEEERSGKELMKLRCGGRLGRRGKPTRRCV